MKNDISPHTSKRFDSKIIRQFIELIADITWFQLGFSLIALYRWFSIDSFLFTYSIFLHAYDVLSIWLNCVIFQFKLQMNTQTINQSRGD